MKKHLLLKIAIAAVIVAFCTSLRAEEITLDPSALIPADTGYYIGGVWKDENEDGIDEFYNGCLDYYDDAHHNENGKQQGFTYAKCMIMPDCWAKNADDELTHELSLVAQGYIEIGKTRYLNTDSARMCYIICPYLENLEKLYIEASPDVSSNEQRHIWFYIQYSTDQGNTWVEDLFIKDETISKFGDLHTYEIGGNFPEFDDIAAASTEGPIYIRIMSGEQRVKIHKIVITADLVEEPVSVNTYEKMDNYFKVIDNFVIAESGSVSVYNTLGQLVAEGNSLYLVEGLYIIKADNGYTRKVIIK